MGRVVREVNKNEQEQRQGKNKVLLKLQLSKQCAETGHNVLGDLGCRHISTGNWNNLITIDLSMLCFYP